MPAVRLAGRLRLYATDDIIIARVRERNASGKKRGNDNLIVVVSGQHIAVTREVIAELDASDKPLLYVYNKCDAGENNPKGRISEDSVAISALTGEGVDALLTAIEEELHRSKRSVTLEIPYSEQSIVSILYSKYTVESVDYLDSFVEVKVKLDAKGLGLYAKYLRD